MRIRGSVKWFNETKGYGFIRRDDGQSDCFVHHSEIQTQGYRTLGEGERVEFDVVQQPKGPKASNVIKLDDADSGPAESENEQPSEQPAEQPSEPDTGYGDDDADEASFGDADADFGDDDAE